MRDSGRRVGALFFALGMQAGFGLLLFVSFTVVRHVFPAQETILLLPSLPKPVVIDARPPLVIDARPKPRTAVPPLAAPTNLPMPEGGSGITVRPVSPPDASELTQRPDRVLGCRPNEQGKPSPLCPPKLADPDAMVLNPPSGVKDEARWAEEKRRRDNHDYRFEVAPGVTMGPGGPGVSIVIQDPLCKLASVLLGGGIHCGAPPRSTAPATDEQFKAALAAYQKRHGYGPLAAPTTKPPVQTGAEKAAGNGAAATPER